MGFHAILSVPTSKEVTVAATAKFTRQLVIGVTDTVGARIDALADTREVSIAQVVREALVVALPKLEARAPKDAKAL